MSSVQFTAAPIVADEVDFAEIVIVSPWAMKNSSGDMSRNDEVFPAALRLKM
jgi:hypothetical protein